MTSKSFGQIVIIALILMAVGLGMTLYKKFALGFPLLPGQYQDVWTVEGKIAYTPTDDHHQATLSLPRNQAGWRIVDEHFTTSGFELSINSDSQHPQANWQHSLQQESATLYYKIQTLRTSNISLPLPKKPTLEQTELSPATRSALDSVIEHALTQHPSDSPLTPQLLLELEQPQIKSGLLFGENTLTTVEKAALLLNHAEIPTALIRGIFLEDGRRRQTISTLIASYENGWIIYNPDTGEAGLPENFLVWGAGGLPILEVIGGRRSSLEFAIVKNSLPLKSVIYKEQLSNDKLILDFSIYSLPVEQQGVFKKILLIPVGALVVVLLRVLVGIRTSGTFMPILIALALIQTSLITGLLIFFTVVGTGLWIRNYLSHLNLLLVARVSSVVIVVILLMAIFSIASYKLGIDQALTVTFFPTIILAWTIERMSILWEEEGGHEVFIQGSGSLFAAVMAFFAMSNRYIEHLTFNFPELLFSLLGVIILLGSYSGYRLTEFYRFRQLNSLDS